MTKFATYGKSFIEFISYNDIVEGGYVGDFFKEAAGPDPSVGNQVVHCGAHITIRLELQRRKKHIV
jgi:hypothetical protein